MRDDKAPSLPIQPGGDGPTPLSPATKKALDALADPNPIMSNRKARRADGKAVTNNK